MHKTESGRPHLKTRVMLGLSGIFQVMGWVIGGTFVYAGLGFVRDAASFPSVRDSELPASELRCQSQDMTAVLFRCCRSLVDSFIAGVLSHYLIAQPFGTLIILFLVASPLMSMPPYFHAPAAGKLSHCTGEAPETVPEV